MQLLYLFCYLLYPRWNPVGIEIWTNFFIGMYNSSERGFLSTLEREENECFMFGEIHTLCMLRQQLQMTNSLLRVANCSLLQSKNSNLIQFIPLYWHLSGADPGIQVRGAHLKKLRRAEGGAKNFGVFRVKNHNFMPKKYLPLVYGV